MITYQQESVSVVFDEGAVLLADHYEELAHHKSKIKLNPDVDSYLGLEKLGALSLTTVRDSGVLVGYSLFIVSKSLHYQDHLYAINDVVFLHPLYRKSKVGIGLLLAAEDHVKSLGSSLIIIAAKVDTSLDKLLPNMGYDHIENTYSKYVGDN